MRPSSVFALFLPLMLAACATHEAQVPVAQPQSSPKLAEFLLRCHHFYATTVDDARRTRPEFFVPGHPFLKTVNASVALRVTADVLIGETTAGAIYDRNVAEWSSKYRLAAMTTASWKSLTDYMTVECKRTLSEVDPTAEAKVGEILRQRGIAL